MEKLNKYWNSSKILKNYVYLFVLYTLAHGGIFLIPNAIFWDDYTLYEMDDQIILDTFDQLGSIFNFSGYLHVFFLVFGPALYKLLTFVMLFLTGLIFDNILKRYKAINVETRFIIVLLTLVLPFYHARVALIVMPYTLSYFLFFSAWLLMSKQRVVSLALFFISFNTNSLLVFFALPFLDHYYHSIKSTPSLRSFYKF